MSIIECQDSCCPSSAITEVNGSKSLEVETLNSGSDLEMARGRRLAWSRLRDLGSRDPGSNPGDPTTALSFPKEPLFKCPQARVDADLNTSSRLIRRSRRILYVLILLFS